MIRNALKSHFYVQKSLFPWIGTLSDKIIPDLGRYFQSKETILQFDESKSLLYLRLQNYFVYLKAGDFVLKNRFETFVFKISGIQE